MSLTNLPIEHIPIADIVIGERRREKFGRLDSLQRSIRTHGLIHPILLRNGFQLVAGGRRLEACRRLEWKTIPVRHVDELSDEDLRAIELDENAEREALSDFASSKARLAQIRQAEAQAKAAPPPLVSGTSSAKKSKGRPKGKKAGSRRDVAEKTGVDRTSQVRTERHVELAEQFPFMQRHGWVQHSVLEAGVSLDKMPTPDQQAAAALLDQDAIPPKTAIQILGNLATMPAAQRKAVFHKAKSDDVMDRRTALTMAAKLPPPPDPGLTELGNAVDGLKRAAKECRDSTFQPKIADGAAKMHGLYKDFFEHMKEKRNAAI